MKYRWVAVTRTRTGRLTMTMPAASRVHWLALEL